MNSPTVPPSVIGRYRVTGVLGTGGMGVVYAAHDDQLDRAVAIKMVRDGAVDTRSRDQLWQEARAAAKVSHPNICQLYDVGEHQGALFFAMERLAGEALSARLARGPVPLGEAAQIALALLSALDELHRHSLLHRDVKPANIFLTPHGVKLLDFGLARAPDASESETVSRLTLRGTVVGTPLYMAPEQLTSGELVASTDLFALAVVVYEMLSGRPPFVGRTLPELIHAIVYEQPPALIGSTGLAAVDMVLHRALSKMPAERYQTAAAMADELRAALLNVEPGAAPSVRFTTRLIVLPLRVLRPDPETDFLAFSLPDAIACSLSGLESIVVRSSAVAARLGSSGSDLDLERLAKQTEVDLALTGTIVRSGDELRVTMQLVEVPGGRLIWSQPSHVTLSNLFQLQDELSQRTVQSLALPLSVREQRLLKHDVPASAAAYEHYLRANERAGDPLSWGLARDLYERCLEEDPSYAPAWARIGRVYRVLGKYGEDDQAPSYFERAEAAFKRSLSLNPDLSLAHNLYAHLQVDQGRAQEAMVHLLARARAHQADAELFAGLVQACRYCGLLDASLAAYHRARRLDPSVPTSVAYAYLMRGENEQALAASADFNSRIMALVLLGREREAVDGLRQSVLHPSMARQFRLYIVALVNLLEGHVAESRQATHDFLEAAGARTDPEGPYIWSRLLARLGEHDRALATLDEAVARGFFCVEGFVRDPWLDPVRTDERFARILQRAQVRQQEALTAFRDAGGEHVLALPAVR